MKKTAFLILSFLTVSLAFAQVAPKKPVPSDYSWRILQEASFLFENNDFNKAMNMANKAKENRKAESKWECYILDNSLSPFAVRRVGSNFDDVLPVLEERQQDEAVNIINKYIKLYSKKRFHESVYEMRSWVEAKSVYPEADYLIGKIYQVEGEYELAYSFYEKARQNASFLDVPDQLFDILYSMSELALQNKKYEEYEQVLLLIMDKDPNFTDNVTKAAIFKIIDSNKSENVDKFFSIFRAESPLTMKALYSLSKIYEERNEIKNSLFCSALATIEGFTRIYNSISERDASYSYTTFAEFLHEIGKHQDILDWCEENRLWDSMLSFAEKCSYRGNVIFANAMLNAMAVNLPNPYYQTNAEKKIVR
ncbi:MAG: hypothetical protein KBT11_04660 [Treponema sp.]|nr:hypothetical protein [Candidatus Treponema equifaecale]